MYFSRGNCRRTAASSTVLLVRTISASFARATTWSGGVRS